VNFAFPEPPEGADLLIRAATAAKEDAGAAWTAWAKGRDLAHIDASSFALLATVYSRLRGSGALGAEESRLAGIWRWSWARNELTLRAAARVLALFSSAGVPCVALKGLPLLLLCHGDRGARVMFDADLLVPEDRLADAWRILREDGWTPKHADPPPRVRPFLHAVPFTHTSGAAIDLHWKPLPFEGTPGAWEGVRARAVPGTVNGTPALFPDPVDLALLAVAHGLRPDPHAALRWVVDLVALLRSRDGRFDWAALHARAGAWGIGAAARRSLRWACLMTAALPPEAAPDGPDPDRDEQRLLAFLFRHGDPRRTAAQVVADQWWNFRRVARTRSLPAGPCAFAGTVLATYRTIWGTRGLCSTVTRAVRRAFLGPPPEALKSVPAAP